MSWTKKFFCPVNGWNCPYFKDEDGSCTMIEYGDNPILECDDAACFYEDDDDCFIWEDEYGIRLNTQELLELGYHIINDVPMKMEGN